MADSTSPEPPSAAAPSAFTAGLDPATGTDLTTGADLTPKPAPGRRPLPDAVAIHLVAVPDAAPPYDGATTTRNRRPAPGRDAADVSQAIAAIASLSRTAPARPGQGQFAGHWPSQFAQVLAETLAGARPPSQLAPWTTQQTRRRISQLGPLLGAAHQPRVKRVVVTSPAGGVLEIAVIVGVGNRVRALAVRLERRLAAPADASSDGLAVDPVLEDHPQAPAAPQPPVQALGAAGQLRAARSPQTAPHGWVCTAIEAA